jgi:hypothetical protein
MFHTKWFGEDEGACGDPCSFGLICTVMMVCMCRQEHGVHRADGGEHGGLERAHEQGEFELEAHPSSPPSLPLSKSHVLDPFRGLFCMIGGAQEPSCASG